MGINIAVLGATGLVGQAFLEILEERAFPVAKIYPLASERSAGQTVFFKNRNLTVLDAASFDFSQVDLLFCSAGSAISRLYVPKARASGCLVIDNSTAFREDANVPLLIPEVNAEKIITHQGLIANPNCVVIQVMTALQPLLKHCAPVRLDLATYQSVSGKGRLANEELAHQSVAILNAQALEHTVLPAQIAFNVIPQIDNIEDNGCTLEELKIMREIHKIWQQPKLLVNATCVRVPVFYGHAVAVHLLMEQALPAAEARQLLLAAPSVEVIHSTASEANSLPYATPITHCIEPGNRVFVSRIRNHPDNPCLLNLWLVADNIRKGAALNAVQIAELLPLQ
jgi:aspartate-semialdehyde dehydrogenase